MQSFSRGWSFLAQAWGMVSKDKDLIKPSLYALVVGLVVSMLGIIPIAGSYLLLGDSTFGQVLTFLLGAVMVFVNFVITYIFSGMTAYLIYGYLAEGDGRMDKAWGIVRRDFFDILTLAAASTAVNLLKSLAQRRSRRGGNVLAGLASAAAGLVEVLWTEAAFLILPAMVIDDLNLKEGAQRVWKITKENLLLIGISTVGVRWVTGLIGFVLGVVGALIGLAVGYQPAWERGAGARPGDRSGRHAFLHLRPGGQCHRHVYRHRLPYLPVPVGAGGGKRPDSRAGHPGGCASSAGGGIELTHATTSAPRSAWLG